MSKKTKLLNFLKGGAKEVAPVEPVKEKTAAEYQQEYANLCARLGDLEYQISLKEEDARLLKQALKRVNTDGATAIAKEAKTAEKEVPNEQQAQLEDKSNA